jgi:hypothetical protein
MKVFDGRYVKFCRYVDQQQLHVSVLEKNYMPYSTLSVCVPEIKLANNEFILSHNANSLATWMEETGLFLKTGRTASYGFIENQPIYKLNDEASKEALSENV